MKARWAGSNVTEAFSDEMVPGSVAEGGENYHHHILVICPVCENLHIVNPARWSWNRDTLTIMPSVLTEWRNGVTGETQRCHWNLTNGEFVIHGDSTVPPTRLPSIDAIRDRAEPGREATDE